MAQSIELLLDAGSEEIVRAQWRTLHKAGLPTEHRGGDRPGNEHHRPHITLFAGPSVPEPEAELAELVDELLGLRVILGSILLFGPRRGAYVIVRQVLPTPGLLAVQQQVAG
ncbi:MAG: hypothetical protein L0H26_07500, partial [Microlunatus sp.]|nr:hypothetical protein [Microlunatus sp.]